MITLKNVTKMVRSGTETLTILDGLSFEIPDGEFVAVTGASGSGKSTLLGLIAGLDAPSSGQIWLDTDEITSMTEDGLARLRSEKVGFIFQSFQLLPTLTAIENVMLPLEIQYMDHHLAKAKAIDWLSRVGLSDRLHHYPTKLSGGEQQRVAIARAFVTSPAIIFADEMTGNLDTHTGAMISDILFSLNKESNTTLVLVTHDKEVDWRYR